MSINKIARLRTGDTTIVFVVVSVVILFALAIGLVILDFHTTAWAADTASEIASRTAADAGLTKALAGMNDALRTQTFDNNTLPAVQNECLINCDATFSYNVTGCMDEGFGISSVGRSGKFTRNVHAKLRLSSVFDNLMYAGQINLLGNNVIIDSPNSTITTNPQGVGLHISKDSVVKAKVKEEYWPLRHILPPWDSTFEISRGPIQNNWTITPQNNGRYDCIDLKAQKLTIDVAADNIAPVVLYITGNVSLDESSELEIKNGASLVMYVDGDVSVLNSSLVNVNSKISDNLLIIGCNDGSKFVLQNNVYFYGIIYAPEADVTLKNYVEYMGSIVSKTILMDSNIQMRHNDNFLTASYLDFPAKFVVQRWWQGKQW